MHQTKELAEKGQNQEEPLPSLRDWNRRKILELRKVDAKVADIEIVNITVLGKICYALAKKPKGMKDHS